MKGKKILDYLWSFLKPTFQLKIRIVSNYFQRLILELSYRVYYFFIFLGIRVLGEKTNR